MTKGSVPPRGNRKPQRFDFNSMIDPRRELDDIDFRPLSRNSSDNRTNQRQGYDSTRQQSVRKQRRTFRELKKREKAAVILAGVTATTLVITPARNMAAGVGGSVWNYGSSLIDSRVYKNNFPGPIPSKVQFPAANNTQISGVVNYVIDADHIQLDSRTKKISIGVNIVPQSSLGEIATPAAVDKTNLEIFKKKPGIYPAYVANFGKVAMTAECDNDLNRVVGTAKAKASLLFVDAKMQADLTNSESAYGLAPLTTTKHNPALYETYVGLVQGDQLPNLNVLMCSVPTAKK